jgi:hypothetical protein
MTTETLPAVSSITENVDRLRTDLLQVERELDQALDVWRTALLTEKKEFQEVVQTKERAWAERDREWQRQRAGYEDRIRELEDHFKTQLAAADQNALRALNELDDAWQRDKLSWQHTALERLRELESHEAQWQAENERQQQALRDLEAKVKQQAESESAQGIREAWDKDKAVWEQSLWQTIEDLHTREAAWANERLQRERYIQTLQAELTAAQEQSTTSETQQHLSDLWLERQIDSLEAQVGFLESAVSTLNPPKTQTVAPPTLREDSRLKLIDLMDRNRTFR